MAFVLSEVTVSVPIGIPQTFVVDAANGPGAHFTSIATAAGKVSAMEISSARFMALAAP